MPEKAPSCSWFLPPACRSNRRGGGAPCQRPSPVPGVGGGVFSAPMGFVVINVRISRSHETATSGPIAITWGTRSGGGSSVRQVPSHHGTTMHSTVLPHRLSIGPFCPRPPEHMGVAQVHHVGHHIRSDSRGRIFFWCPNPPRHSTAPRNPQHRDPEATKGRTVRCAERRLFWTRFPQWPR